MLNNANNSIPEAQILRLLLLANIIIFIGKTGRVIQQAGNTLSKGFNLICNLLSDSRNCMIEL